MPPFWPAKWTLSIQVIQYRRYPQPMNMRAKQMIEKVGGTSRRHRAQQHQHVAGRKLLLLQRLLSRLLLFQQRRHRRNRSRRKNFGAMTHLKRKSNKSIDSASKFRRISTHEIILETVSIGFAGLRTFFSGVILSGCASSPDNPVFSENPVTPSQTMTGSPESDIAPSGADAARFHVGETVIVSFSGTAQDLELEMPPSKPNHQG